MLGVDWQSVQAQLDQRGYATIEKLLTPKQCRDLAAMYREPKHFRSRIVMQRHTYGHGEYQYFANPLPSMIGNLRREAYAGLVPIANRWRGALGQADPYPDDLDGFLARCHEAGQRRPTPLLLKYGPGDYNRLHQDLYG
ncbi:MAG: 2OG-Fe(II) oxygenase, partial [Pseudomonadota bacterium]